MSEIATADIVMAAVQAAGPAGDNPAAWSGRVRDLALDIALLVEPSSKVSRLVERLRTAKPIVGTILGGRVEASSTRLVVDLLADKGGNGEPESFRTDRTDSPEGRAIADKIRRLKGHRVVAYKAMEDTGDPNKKVRVLVHVIDLGVDTDADAKIAARAAA